MLTPPASGRSTSVVGHGRRLTPRNQVGATAGFAIDSIPSVVRANIAAHSRMVRFHDCLVGSTAFVWFQWRTKGIRCAPIRNQSVRLLSQFVGQPTPLPGDRCHLRASLEELTPPRRATVPSTARTKCATQLVGSECRGVSSGPASNRLGRVRVISPA